MPAHHHSSPDWAVTSSNKPRRLLLLKLLHCHCLRQRLLLALDLVDYSHPGVQPHMADRPAIKQQIAVLVGTFPVAVLQIDIVLLGEDFDFSFRPTRRLESPLREHELPKFTPSGIHCEVRGHPLKRPREDGLHAPIAPASCPPNNRIVAAAFSQVIHHVDRLAPLEDLNLDAKLCQPQLQFLRLLDLLLDEIVRGHGRLLALQCRLGRELGVSGLDGLLGFD
mmetsp:Transcript_12315/g.30118  ORF Transcript_12315/g.30118 Transcript_12315/m.30118 type:complete len:223 (+) Transcript_12315:255-923(+)